MSKCVVCENHVNWKKVKQEFEEILEQTDRYGLESLTEHKQVVYHGLCCSRKCYQDLR